MLVFSFVAPLNMFQLAEVVSILMAGGLWSGALAGTAVFCRSVGAGNTEVQFVLGCSWHPSLDV